MNVVKELHHPAPRPGVAVYALSPSYARPQGAETIEAIRLEAPNRDRSRPGLPYYSPEIVRRRSMDNGRSWSVEGEVYREDPFDLRAPHLCAPVHFLDASNGRLLRIQLTRNIDPLKTRESFSDEGITNRFHRPVYAVSHDAGRTWTPARPLVHAGRGYDDAHWGPGLYYGKNGGGGDLSILHRARDGEILYPMTVNLEDGKRYQAVLLHGRWSPALDSVEWRFSDYISMSPNQSSQGCCEPAMALLDDGAIFISLRCCGDREGQTFPSLKYWVVSRDGGWTFSTPQPLTYEDGAPVWSPSSYAGAVRSSANGRYYWIGNILDKPTFTSYPRHPLRIAELVPERGCLVRQSVTVIDDKPPDFPEENRRRYTNFGLYEDRETREIVLTLPEQPRVDWTDFTADCYRYRVTV